MFVTLFSWLNKTFQIFMTAQNTVLGEYSSSISMREEMRKTVPNRTVNKEPQPYLLKNTYKNELGSSSPTPLTGLIGKGTADARGSRIEHRGDAK